MMMVEIDGMEPLHSVARWVQQMESIQAEADAFVATLNAIAENGRQFREVAAAMRVSETVFQRSRSF